MNKEDAFKECLEKQIKPSVTKGTWSSYQFRFRNGKLKDKTIEQLLLKYGYRKTQEEQWSNEQDYIMFVVQFYYDIIDTTYSQKLKYYSIQAKDENTALGILRNKAELIGRKFGYINITNLPISLIVNRISNML